MRWAGVGLLVLISNIIFAEEITFKVPGLDISKGSISGVTSIAVGDINRDGLPDIAVFEGGKHAYGRKTFAWFQAPNWTRRSFNSSYSPGPFTGDSKLADLDGDGDLDLILPQDPHSGSGTGYLYWYRNPGGSADGGWTRILIGSWSDALHIGEVEVADMDGDGKLDVVIRHLGGNKVRICFQNSATSWTIRTLSVRLREGLTLADLDRDGRTDILLNGFWWAAPANPRTESFTEYKIDSTFYSQPIQDLNNSTKAAVGDIDGDGIKDVVMVPAEGQKAHLAWYKCPANPRTQSWVRHIIESNWGNMHQVELGDFDKDGDLDIAGGRSFGETGIFIWRNNNGGQSWARQTLSSTAGMYSGRAVDIGADGDLDLVAPSYYSKSSVPLFYENVSTTGSPTPLTAPGNAAAVATSETSIRVNWQDTTTSETGFKIYRKSGTSSAVQIASVGANATSYQNSGLTSNTRYTYYVVAYNSTVTSPPSNEASATTPAPPAEEPDPAPEYPTSWSSKDIGAVAKAGTATWGAVDQCTITGSGADIWGNADEFHFVYQSLTGDGELIARVTSQNGEHAWAKAGLMIRESLLPGSRHGVMEITRLNGSWFYYRSATGGTTGKVDGNDSLKAPAWLKISRQGSVISGFVSSDGVNWRLITSKTISLPSTAYWGMAVTSHQDGSFSTAGFDNIVLHGGTASAKESSTLTAPSGLTTSATSASTARLTWADQNSAESGFKIERRIGTGSFAVIGQTSANALAFEDSGLSTGVDYTYRVLAFNSTQASPPSNESTIRLASTEPEPVAWANRDIGAVAARGSTTWSGTDKCTIAGSGADIWGTVDEFHFAYKPIQGDAVMITRVASQAGGDQWAKAGLMIRESLANNSRHALIELTRLNGSIFDFRTATGGTTSKIQPKDGLKAPAWLKIARSGNTISGFVSTDGANWRLVGSKSMTLPAACYWGPAVTSHQDGTLATAVFEQISTAPSGYAASSIRDAGAVASVIAGEPPVLEVGTRQSGGQTSFELSLKVPAAAVRTFHVQESADFSRWTDICTLTTSDLLFNNGLLAEVSRSTEGTIQTIQMRTTEPVTNGTVKARFFRVVSE